MKTVDTEESWYIRHFATNSQRFVGQPVELLPSAPTTIFVDVTVLFSFEIEPEPVKLGLTTVLVEISQQMLPALAAFQEKEPTQTEVLTDAYPNTI